MNTIELGSDGEMKWERVDPPFWWSAAKRYVVGDRHLSNGVRQHLVQGSVPMGTIISNAEVIGEADLPLAEFSNKASVSKG